MVAMPPHHSESPPVILEVSTVEQVHIAQEISLLLFFCPPLRSLTCPFERNDLPYGPAPGALWEDSALTKVPSETSGGQHYAVDEAGEDDLRPFPLGPWSSFVWFSWKQICLLPLLHSQEHLTLEWCWEISHARWSFLCLFPLFPAMPVAVQALSHLPKRPVGFGDEGGDWEYHSSSSLSPILKNTKVSLPSDTSIKMSPNVLKVVAMLIITIPFEVKVKIYTDSTMHLQKYTE